MKDGTIVKSERFEIILYEGIYTLLQEGCEHTEPLDFFEEELPELIGILQALQKELDLEEKT